MVKCYKTNAIVFQDNNFYNVDFDGMYFDSKKDFENYIKEIVNTNEDDLFTMYVYYIHLIRE